MSANNHPGYSQFGIQGHDWQDLCRIHIQVLGFVVSEMKIFHVNHIISLWRIMTLHGHGQFKPQGHGWHDF